MFVRNRTGAPGRERSGLVSRVLPREGDVLGVGLAATWVEVAPGWRQRPPGHVPGQAYGILQGRGKMRVGEEELRVEEGDLVHTPPDALHGIENAPEGALVYVSATTPALYAEVAYDTGWLGERPGEERGGERAHG